jgi:hypothetical protein
MHRAPTFLGIREQDFERATQAQASLKYSLEADFQSGEGAVELEVQLVFVILA